MSRFTPVHLAVIVAVGTAVAIIAARQLRTPSGPPYAVAEPIAEPRLFGDGVISTADDEFGGSFTPDGRTIYFSRSAPHSYLYVIMESRWVDGQWSAPSIVPISGRWSDSDPVLSPDGQQMYWSSDRPVDGKIKHDYDIWMSTRQSDGTWGEPVHLPAPINSDASEFCASVARNGTLYFSSERDGGPGGSIRVYRSHPESGGWSAPENLTEAMGAKHDDVVYDLDVLVDPDEKMLFVGSSGRPDGLGNFDIYVSRNTAGKWGPLVHLPPPINTPTRDYSPHPSPDGKYLFFTSERGFTASTVTTRLTSYSDLVSRLRGTLNGSGNVYQMSMSVIDSLAGH